jgi:hypothetical protein
MKGSCFYFATAGSCWNLLGFADCKGKLSWPLNSRNDLTKFWQLLASSLFWGLVILFDSRAQREKLLKDLTPQQRTWYHEGKSLDEIARLSWAEAEKTKEAGTGEGRPDDSAKSKPVVAE